MIRTLIVEDEPLARSLLRSYIAVHDDLDLIGEACDGPVGLRMVDELLPDLLLLDIRLPEMSGLALARQMRHTPAIVFITAYDRHAITAFELGAFDYLLKPVLPERFSTAIERIRARGTHSSRAENIGAIDDRLAGTRHEGYLQHFFVRHLGAVVPVHVAEIVRLEADDDYTAIHVAGRRLLVHVPLREMAARLDPAVFVRVHRCDIVNLAHVRSGQPVERRLILLLSDGSQVTTSRTGMQALRTRKL